MRFETSENDRPRVAYILKRFPRLSETFIANEILALERRGFEITIFSIKDPADPVHPFVREIAAPVHYMPRPSWRGAARFFVAHLGVFLRSPRGWLRCARYSRRRRSRESWKKFLMAGIVARGVLRGRIGHLHSHFATGSTRLAKYVSLMTGVPFSFTAHAKDIFTDRVGPKGLRRRMRMAKFVVTISEFNRKYLREICDDAEIHVVRNGLPVDRFPMNNGGPKKEERPIVLGVGRFVEKKGFPGLIDACAELKRRNVNFRCLLVGDGPERAEIERRIEAHGLAEHVTLEGRRTQGELIDSYYRRAMLFALPCRVAENNDMDGLPVVLTEAMAMGIPVVTTPVTGIPELVDHRRTGLLVPPDDPAALAASIESLLGDEPLRDDLRRTARRVIEEEYDIDACAGRLAEIFRGADHAG